MPLATFTEMDIMDLRLRGVVTSAGFGILAEDSLRYEPASAGLPPEIQITLCCRVH